MIYVVRVSWGCFVGAMILCSVPFLQSVSQYLGPFPGPFICTLLCEGLPDLSSLS